MIFLITVHCKLVRDGSQKLANVKIWQLPKSFNISLFKVKFFYNIDHMTQSIFSFGCQFFVENEAIARMKETSEKPCPELFSSLPSYITFSWITGLIWTGFRRPLTSGKFVLVAFRRVFFFTTSCVQLVGKQGLIDYPY